MGRGQCLEEVTEQLSTEGRVDDAELQDGLGMTQERSDWAAADCFSAWILREVLELQR